jgi:F-type H+-transporting ATPase subunit delta
MPTAATVENVYALALIELAEAQNALTDIADEAADLRQLLADQPQLVGLLSSPAISVTQRAAGITRIFQGKCSDLLHQFLQTVNRKGRLAQLPAILAAVARLVQERRGLVEADAYVAQPLSDADLARVSARLGAALGGKHVVLRQHHDGGLIGGMRLRVGDQLIDASVATQLKRLQRNIVAAGREQYRTHPPITA